MIGTLLLAAAPIDLTTLPQEVLGPAIGYEICLFRAADELSKSPPLPAKPYEVAERACAQEWGRLDVRIGLYFIERSLDAGRQFTDKDFEAAEEIREALAKRAQVVFEADLKALQQK
jgi:hypothetical protein